MKRAPIPKVSIHQSGWCKRGVNHQQPCQSAQCQTLGRLVVDRIIIVLAGYLLGLINQAGSFPLFRPRI
ncbi:hypothetical protein BDW75DRAFT_61318 [Aspergillus navahoensis]